MSNSRSTPLKLNRTFAKNIIKYTDDNNRITSNIKLTNQRKFVNEERKKHTKLQLSAGSRTSKEGKTMYSDYVSEKLVEKSSKKGIIHPLEQMKKLVKDAAEFDNVMSEKEVQKLSGTFIPQKRPKLTLDKTLLHNHLKHTNIHNRLKEEGAMWEKFDIEKKRTKLQSKRSQEPIKRGGMYADSEPGASITAKLPDEERTVKERKTLKRTIFTSNHERPRKVKRSTVESINIHSSDDDRVENQLLQRKRKVSRVPLKKKYVVSHKRNVIIEDVPLKKKKAEPVDLKTYGKLNADQMEEIPVSRVTSKKWGHDGFFEQEKTPVTKPTSSVMRKKAITISDDENNDADSNHKTKSRHILKSSIHVKPLSNKKSVERDEKPKKVQRTIQKKSLTESGKKKGRRQRSSSSSSESSSNSSSSSSGDSGSGSGSSSSLTSSSSDDDDDDDGGDEKPAKRKQLVKHKRNKVKNTFSDYDSDFKPRS